MKSNITILTLATFLVSLVTSCSQKGGKTTEVEAVTVPEKVEEIVKETKAVCVWNELSVRKEPKYNKNNYLTSLSKGERLTSLGITKYDSAGKTEYVKVKLNDGTEGWSSRSLIVDEADPAVLAVEAAIYKRPDLLTKTDRAFDQLDIVAVVSVDGGWAEIKGQRNGTNFVSEGWIKKDVLSTDNVDIAMAKFIRKASSMKDEDKKIESLTELLENSDFQSSKFVSVAQEILNEIKGEETIEETVSEVDSIE